MAVKPRFIYGIYRYYVPVHDTRCLQLQGRPASPTFRRHPCSYFPKSKRIISPTPSFTLPTFIETKRLDLAISPLRCHCSKLLDRCFARSFVSRDCVWLYTLSLNRNKIYEWTNHMTGLEKSGAWLPDCHLYMSVCLPCFEEVDVHLYILSSAVSDSAPKGFKSTGPHATLRSSVAWGCAPVRPPVVPRSPWLGIRPRSSWSKI